MSYSQFLGSQGRRIAQVMIDGRAIQAGLVVALHHI